MSLRFPSRLSGMTLVKGVLEQSVSPAEAAQLLDRVDLQEFFGEVALALAADKGVILAPNVLQALGSKYNSPAPKISPKPKKAPGSDLDALWQDTGGGD